MSSKCLVPNCENTVGIPFPKNSDLKKGWLKALKIIDAIPDEESFICLDHFDKKDVCEILDAEARICRSIKEGAIPIITPPNEEIASQESSYVSDTAHIKEEADTIHSEYTGENRQNDNENFLADHRVKGIKTGFISKQMCTENIATQISPNNIKNSDVPEVVLFNAEDCTICRLCGTEGYSMKNIFKEKIENVLVSVAIMECIYPIEILETDRLSKYICNHCLQTLTSYFKFRSICLENDKQQRDIDLCGPINNAYTDDSSVAGPSTSDCLPARKRKAHEDNSNIADKKQRFVEIFTDSEEDYSDADLDSLSDFIIHNEPEIKTYSRKKAAPKKNVVDKNFVKVEEELRRVLEGKLTEEQAKAENIIIHVENDAEEKSPDKVATLSKLKLPIVIKPIKVSTSVNQDTRNRALIKGDLKMPARVVRLDSQVNVQPKKPNNTLKKGFKSDIGLFQGVPINYVFDTEFCEVDGYLYEYRLCKGNTRFLRCVLPSCNALAVQNKLDSNEYSTEMTVEKHHAHMRPSTSEKKRQMFYYVMKRKMQSDKTLNFRSVYDEVCTFDPDIKELVPLRNVINEICRHQLTYKIPQLNTFEQFYDYIEEDVLQKLHFTHTGKQFYHEKFVADDGSMAVMFANSEVIEEVASSKLMYVDASFKIDTNEKFTYQLVTVLVWVDESYYPILFALVNKKTQEIYKKIFEYLCCVLAPKLQPDEIVTDYEANLYYALAETYLNSHIGGSVFYYTQNLYKRLCALNLSRDLETNSYFRNIYHMILMLPLLPVNTILDGLSNMEIQAKDLGVSDLTKPIFDHVHSEWIMKVTPVLFCVHRLENRINENVIAPFKKLRDFIMLSKGKMQKQQTNIITVVEKLIELENFLQVTYATPNKKSFARDLSSSQKKNVLKAWQYIESHPKININNFFSKVLGYIKCMENQLWIWGFYRYTGTLTDELINATNFSIMSNDVEVETHSVEVVDISETEYVKEEETIDVDEENGQVVMEAVIDENGSFVLQNKGNADHETQFENAFLRYVYKDTEK